MIEIYIKPEIPTPKTVKEFVDWLRIVLAQVEKMPDAQLQFHDEYYETGFSRTDDGTLDGIYLNVTSLEDPKKKFSFSLVPPADESA